MWTRVSFGLFLLVAGALVVWPVGASAQEATVSGTVTDSTGGVLPGVTVTATHTASGNTFLAVTDERGGFRLPLRTGAFRLTFELPGFTTVTRTLELLVGQQPVVNLQMAPGTVQETVTVTGEAPLIETTSSTVSGNIDPRQMQELPVNGRNWQDLALLAPGNRSNAVLDQPVDVITGGTFQLNIDGQQVTQLITFQSTHGGPKYSRDAIAEFEFVANRFDVTQGRSLGIQVNAVTKSGTNDFAGTFGSYFRSDRWNAADHVAKRVLPYSDQQMSATFGGPIRRDRIHFFGNFEYEREPNTVAFTTPYPHFNQDLRGTHRERTGGGRVDTQFSPQTRLSVRYTYWRNFLPFGRGAAIPSSTQTPAAAIQTSRWMNQAVGTLTQVFGSRVVNELKLGYARYTYEHLPLAKYDWPPGLTLGTAPPGFGAPRISLSGIVVGLESFYTPQSFDQPTYSIRDNLTHSFDARGRHEVKVGAEYLHFPIHQYFCNYCFGHLDASRAAIPASVESLFPEVRNANTYNLAALSPIAIRWQQGFGNFEFDTGRNEMAAWVQDDWTITPRLTLNLGVRYDLQLNVFMNEIEVLPWMPGNRPNDNNNVAPRVGAVYSLNDRTAVRGGYGLFYGEISNTNSHFPMMSKQVIVAEVQNDGRPDFATNPFNGPTPTYERVRTQLCTPANPFAAGCIRNSLVGAHPEAEAVIPYSRQASIGLQRQLGPTIAITTDYVYTGGRRLPLGRQMNISYNPDTGLNYPFTDIRRRPHPEWGSAVVTFYEGRSNRHSLDTTLTKRFSQGWQLSANYSLSGYWDADAPVFSGVANLPPDLGAEYSLAASDQRHRAVVNGVWEVGGGFQVSGLYFYGSGQRFSTSYGGDRRNLGPGARSRLRPDGTIVPRNDFVGEPIHRVDLRLQERVPLWGGVRVDGILEVFNLFNRANFGSYVTDERSSRYGLPNVETNVAYVPRTLQLGFRVAF